MENNISTKNVIVNYGIYLGVTSIIVSLIKYAMGMQYEQEYYSGIVGLILMILFIILGLKNYQMLIL